MPKKLKIWNVKGWAREDYDEDSPTYQQHVYPRAASHIYICAHSRKHASEIMAEHLPRESHMRWADENYKTLRDYGSEGCWGDRMKGIEPEIGIWVAVGYDAHPEIKCVWKESDNDTE